MDQEKYNAGRDALKDLSDRLIVEWPRLAAILVGDENYFVLFSAFFLLGLGWSAAEVKQLIQDAVGADELKGLV